VDHPRARLAAIAAMKADDLPEALRDEPSVRRCASLEELLRDGSVDLVSLCSPRRRDQAGDAIRCLEAGVHVYAEKPCALSERDLDAVLFAAERTGRRFREMAGTAFDQPYLALRELVARGTLGTVVQVLAQKSYPYHERRPQDEDVDGGLTCQAGVHAVRFIEHVARTRVKSVEAMETRLGCPREGGLRMASAMTMTLENGGLATVIANYLNPRAFPSWGNETLRIFGTEGFVEAVDGGTRTRLVLRDRDCGPVAVDAPSLDYLSLYLASLQGEGEMPLSSEEELHPTRVVLRAKAFADARRK
jgi:predicted dehydrogenase